MAIPRKMNVNYSLTILLSPGPGSYLILYSLYLYHPFKVQSFSLPPASMSPGSVCVPLSPLLGSHNPQEGILPWWSISFSTYEGCTNGLTQFCTVSPTGIYKSEPNPLLSQALSTWISSVLPSPQCHCGFSYPIGPFTDLPPCMHRGARACTHTHTPSDFSADSSVDWLRRILL